MSQAPEVRVESKFDCGLYAVNVCPAGENVAWLARWDCSNLYLCNEIGEMLQTISMGKYLDIRNVVADKSGDAIVCCRDKIVRLVTRDGTISTLIDTSPFIPEVACMTENGDIVLILKGQCDDDHVAIYSADGKRKIREVKGTQPYNKFTTDMQRLAVNGDDISVVSNNSVVTFDIGGRVKWTYHGSNAKLDKKFDPCGMCVDKFHNLLITDFGSYCVHCVNKDGDFITMLLTPEQHGIERPWAIGIDWEDRIWLLGSNKKIWIAKYLS